MNQRSMKEQWSSTAETTSSCTMSYHPKLTLAEAADLIAVQVPVVLVAQVLVPAIAPHLLIHQDLHPKVRIPLE